MIFIRVYKPLPEQSTAHANHNPQTTIELYGRLFGVLKLHRLVAMSATAQHWPIL